MSGRKSSPFRALEMSRDGLISRALERELAGGGGWSEGFFSRLRDTDDTVASAVDEMLEAIRAHRSSKEPTRL